MRPTDALQSASDEFLQEVVRHADPMVLRGLLFQVTGNEKLRGLSIVDASFGYAFVDQIEHPEDIATIQSLAVDFLKHCRSAQSIELGRADRLLESLRITTGLPLAREEEPIWVEQAAFDPWARGIDADLLARLPDRTTFTVAVIGAGLSGLNAAAQLQRAGFCYTVFEKNEEVGGAWWENKYPGARVDTPSQIYSHIFGSDFSFPEVFCARDVNLSYMQWVSRQFAVREQVEFGTEVISLIWDEDRVRWRVTARNSEGRLSVRYFNAVISCVGFLSRPNDIAFRGLGSFRGPAFHSARWPDDLDISGKRIGVIGSGASGYQLVPVVAKKAAAVMLFQRTPSWCFENSSYLKPLSQSEIWLNNNFPFYRNFARLRLSSFFSPSRVAAMMQVDHSFQDPHTISATNKKMWDICVDSVTRKLASKPHLIEKMIPDHPPMASRPIMVDDKDSILDALARENVTLVTEPIERVTPCGLLAGDTEYSLDVIIFAIGFRANDYLWPMKVVGRAGMTIEKLWSKDGPRAYLGSMLPGFPNFFMAYGPNTNTTSGLQFIDLMELEVRFALQCLGEMMLKGAKTIDVTEEAYVRFNLELDKEESNMVYMDSRACNYWTNGKGRSATNLPIDFRRMWRWLRDPGASPPANLDAGVAPFFGHDLVVT